MPVPAGGRWQNRGAPSRGILLGAAADPTSVGEFGSATRRSGLNLYRGCRDAKNATWERWAAVSRDRARSRGHLAVSRLRRTALEGRERLRSRRPGIVG